MIQRLRNAVEEWRTDVGYQLHEWFQYEMRKILREELAIVVKPLLDPPLPNGFHPNTLGEQWVRYERGLINTTELIRTTVGEGGSEDEALRGYREYRVRRNLPGSM